jgi:hypothetical protein
MKKLVSSIAALALAGLVCMGAVNTTTTYRIAELSSAAAIDVAKRHFPASPDSFLTWHYATYPLVWDSPPPTLTSSTSGKELSYGSIYVSEGSTAQTGLSTTPAKMTGFTTAGPASGISTDAGKDRLIVSKAGSYLAAAQVSFSGSASTTFQFHLHKNSAELAQAGFHRALGVGGDVGSASLAQILELAAGDTVDIYVEAGASSKEITPVDAQLSLTQLLSEGASAETDRLVAADVAMTHFPSAPGAFLVWHEGQYPHLWYGTSQPRTFLNTQPRIVTADSGDVFLWVGFKPGELDTTLSIYGEVTADICKAWDPDSTEFLRRTTVQPISFWPDGSVMDAHVSFFAPRADTFQLRADSTAASYGQDTLFTTPIAVPFDVWVNDTAGTGVDTLAFTAGSPTQGTLRRQETMLIKHTPNYTEQYMIPITEVTHFDSVEFHVYQRTYLSGETRTWLTMYNNAPISGSDNRENRMGDFGSVDPVNALPIVGITMNGSDSLRIRYADDMYWGDLATACTSGVAGDSIWWDGMVNDSSWAYGIQDGDTTVVGGAGSWPYDIEMRAREKVSWQIVTGGNQADAEPTFAYLIPDEDGFNRYTDLDIFGKIAPFSYDDADSFDVWYEAQAQTGVAQWHTRYLGGRINSGVDSTEFGGEKLLQVAFWMNPRMHHLPFKDWDSKFHWALEGHNWAEEYEPSHGLGVQFLRTAGAVDDSLPTDFAKEAFELGYLWTWGHAQQGFYHTDGDTTAAGDRNEPLNWIGEWQMGHPTHGANGLGSVGRPSAYTDIAHFNGRNLLMFYRLTGDPVIGEQWYDMVDRVAELVNCTMSCGSCGNCPEDFLAMEERAGANHIWHLSDSYQFTGSVAHRDLAKEFIHRTTSGNTQQGVQARPFLFDPNPYFCKKKAWMISRMISSIRDFQDVGDLRGYTALRTELDPEVSLWAEFVENYLVDPCTDWSAVCANWDSDLGSRTTYHLASSTDAGTCCPDGCSATCALAGAAYGDPEIAAWDMSVANALVGIAGVDQDLVDELYYAGVYYAEGEELGLPWTYYKMLASGTIIGSGQRYLHERYHE